MRSRPSSLLTVGLAAGLYLALALYQIHLPGLHYDEAREAGVPAMQVLLGQPLDAFRGSALRAGGRAWPLMVQDYIGALNAYLAVPFLALGGVRVESLRLLPVLCGLATLLFVWDLARRAYSERAASWAAVLLAVQPAFVFWNRQGIYVTSITATLFALALWSGWRWLQEGRRRWGVLMALACGLGLWAKLLFLWALGAMWGAWVLLAWGRWGRALPRRDPLGLLLGGLAFLVPLVPLALFNWQTSGTLLTIVHNLGRSYYGVDNLAFGQNLAARLWQVRDVLAGTPFWYLGGTFGNPWWPPALALGAVGSLVLVLGREDLPWRRLLFPYLALGLIVVQSCFTVSALWHSHFALALPLPALALASTLDALARAARGRKALGALAALAVAFLVLWDLGVDVRYHQALARTGGLGGHTEAIYTLAERLRAAPHPQPLALDWGIAAPVEFLTEGRVRPLEVFGYESLEQPDAGFQERLRALVREPGRYHLFHAPEETVYRGRLEAYQAVLEEEGLQGRVVGTVHDRSGRLIFVVGEAVPALGSP
ncbi:MAG: ArnT family glycosyltransferase [Anaerolineae bacterium]